MNQEKVKEVYFKIKKELEDGAGWDKYVALQEQYVRLQDFESAEGLRLAFADFGVSIHKVGNSPIEGI